MSYYKTQVSFMLIAFDINVNSIGIHYKTFYRKKPERIYYVTQEDIMLPNTGGYHVI